MKQFYFLTLFLITQVSFSQVNLPYYDGFDYTVGAKLRGQGGWLSQNGTGADSIYVAADNLLYTGLPTSVGNKIKFAAIGNDDYIQLTSLNTGTVYYSFLFQANSMTGVTDANGGYFSGFNSNLTTFGGTLWTKRVDDNTYNFGIEVRTANSANTSWTSSTYNVGTTYLVVVSYTFGGGSTSDDIVNLWVNPTLGGTEPVANLTDTHSATDLTAISGFFFRQDSATETPDLDIDELRIGTTWESVTPSSSAGLNNNVIEGFSMYPNPAKNQLFINTSNNLTKNIQIFDVLGKQVLSETLEGNSLNLNLNSGVYIIKIEEAGKLATQKLVIE